ncbi:hypothetical protein NUACC21_56080 [Scytonema sp. NUACC21]
MQLMHHLSKLLNTKNSDLIEIVQSGLYGLRAQIEEALKKYPQDSGISDCQEILKALNSLLESAPKQNQKKPDDFLSEDDFPFEPASGQNHDKPEADLPSDDDFPFEPIPKQPISPLPVAQLEMRLIRLKAFISEQKLQDYLGSIKLQSTNDSELWKEIQLLLLRVPANIADSCQKKTLELAQEVGALKNEESLLDFSFSRDEVLYPGLKNKVEAQGLCLSKKLPCDLHPAELPREGDLFFLANVVSTCLKFIDHDQSNLHHALKIVNRFGVKSLKSDSERSMYIEALTKRLRRAQAVEHDADPIVALHARLDLDEAIHSLVYHPPADRYSWWGKLQQESRQTLDRVVEKIRLKGNKVHTRPLWGPYADICTLSKDDWELDSGGTPGEVLACLRVYAKINSEELPGRVLYRGRVR